jgi:hypothetical protein
MRFLSSLPQIQKEVLFAVGGVIGVFILLWLWSRFTRRRHLVIAQSETTDMMAIQLGRIADAIEHLAAASRQQESRPIPAETMPVAPEASPSSSTRQHHVSLSMLGR